MASGLLTYTDSSPQNWDPQPGPGHAAMIDENISAPDVDYLGLLPPLTTYTDWFLFTLPPNLSRMSSIAISVHGALTIIPSVIFRITVNDATVWEDAAAFPGGGLPPATLEFQATGLNITAADEVRWSMTVGKTGVGQKAFIYTANFVGTYTLKKDILATSCTEKVVPVTVSTEKTIAATLSTKKAIAASTYTKKVIPATGVSITENVKPIGDYAVEPSIPWQGFPSIFWPDLYTLVDEGHDTYDSGDRISSNTNDAFFRFVLAAPTHSGPITNVRVLMVYSGTTGSGGATPTVKLELYGNEALLGSVDLNMLTDGDILTGCVDFSVTGCDETTIFTPKGIYQRSGGEAYPPPDPFVE